ncbi:TetR/AcrR family transcriptional regulator [Arthrobacter sp. PM3]|uniref:TetR/AcrR family transcriptional regulator n=1 Tax=Arthrobacter sp. PM3 TaxID=2017685 RepID=UPI000E104C32|nr:TetR/AcrR family transcriptional regulator [Arthrobacter sp. PM3]AXJ08637.1 TetR family transcriptional regulator [Arthrobacter sp. PM3]
MSEKLARILNAATTCIARSGVRGMRVNDVAAEAGVSPGLLYYHFTDRAGLLAATLDHINKQVGKDDAAPASPEAGDPARHFRHLLLDEIKDDVDVRRNSVAWNELRACSIFEQELAEPLSRTTAEWNREIARALVAATDGTSQEEAAVTAEILTCLVEGISGRWLNGFISTDHARSLVTTAINSLTAAHGSAVAGRS